MSPPSLNELLKQTSRSFYLTLRVLPRAIRPQIGLAYLLARTTDTIADTEIVPVAQRLAALQALRERILGTSRTALNFGELARQQGLPAERMLLERGEEALAVLGGLAETDLKLVRKVLATITSGQELDLQRFDGARPSTPALTPALSPGERENPGNDPANPTRPDPIQNRNKKHPLLGERAGVRADYFSNLIALQNDAELDDYTYRVAGCVGEFWTEMCVAHLFGPPQLTDLATPRFKELGVRFGKGLQLVNILRDIPADLRKGRCYLPANKLLEAGLTPADLLAPGNESKFRPLYHQYLDWAEAHLAAGWEYTNLIPFTQLRLRLACAWPILIGVETLKRLRGEPVLDPARRVKVSRATIRSLMIRSVWRYPFRRSWQKLVTFSS